MPHCRNTAREHTEVQHATSAELWIHTVPMVICSLAVYKPSIVLQHVILCPSKRGSMTDFAWLQPLTVEGINNSGFWREFAHLSIVSQDRAWAHLPTSPVSFCKDMSHNLFRAYAQMFPNNMNMIKFSWVQIYPSKTTQVKSELLLSRLHTHGWKLHFLSFNSDPNYSFFLHYPCFREPVTASHFLDTI